MTTAKNPILKGFYPDPSICRVGDDFYLVNSSFSYVPGVPIFHSRDLSHWEQIGNVLDRESQLSVRDEISRGIFAPTIREYNGTFYMITTNVSDGGSFIVIGDNPKGPWSDPYYLGDDAKGIDPSLFFDGDGRCYYVGTRPNENGEQYFGDWEIWIQELDLKSMKLIGKSMAIWKGALKDVIWPEGPHLYKKDGYYYLLHAEAGTEFNHAISVARSKELFKWFEGCPRNPIFTHRNLGKDYPIINVGHGDLVDDKNGNWYMVMLASRPCLGKCSMGRETFLAKVVWEDGWPVVNPGVGHLTDEVEINLPEYRFDEEYTSKDIIDFSSETLDCRLLSIGNRDDSLYSLKDKTGILRIKTSPEKIEDIENPAYLGLRQKSNSFVAECSFKLYADKVGDCGGMVLFQNHENNLQLLVKNEANSLFFTVRAFVKGKEQIIASQRVDSNDILIRICGKNQKAEVELVINNELISFVKDVDLTAYTTEEAGGFVGCTIGMYAHSDNVDSNGYVEFKSFSMSYV